jgi:integrase/recombinase XerD
MLLAGVTIEQVAKLLGHTSTRVTERHYAPWVAARQLQAEQAVKLALSLDPLAAELQKKPIRQ